jgi:amino acid transporter
VSSRSDFVSAVARYGGNYSKIIADGHAAGYTASSIRFNPTFVGIAVAAVAFLYPFLGVYGGSELRRATTEGRRAIYGALLVAVILTLPTMFLADRVIGVNFLGAATTLGSTGSKNYPFTPAPFYFFFVSMLTNQTWLIVIMNLSVTISLLALGPPSLFMCSRCLFAWSFDHITPTKLSSVNERTHAPVLAATVMLVVGVAILAISVFAARTLLSLVFTAILAQLMSLAVLGIAGTIFPYRRRDLYEGSAVRRSVAGIPLMSIIAAVSTAFFGLLIYWYASRSVLGANTQTGWIAIGVIFGLGIVIYPISKWLNRERGIDLGVSFRTLPPD